MAQQKLLYGALVQLGAALPALLMVVAAPVHELAAPRLVFLERVVACG